MNDEATFKINPRMRLCSKYLRLNWIVTSPGQLQAACPATHTTKDGWVTGKCCGVIVVQADGELNVYYRDDVDWENRLLHAWIRKRIREYIYEMAAAILPARLHFWECVHNITVPDGIIVKKLRKNILGYCTGRMIALTPRIILLPEADMDSVILHEMAHLKHMNHGKRFWAHLSALLGEDARKQKEEMNLRSGTFYAYSQYLCK